jgi:hypothetical protein
MSTDRIKLLGKIVFSPDNKTKKHNKQSSWKKIAMVMFDGDVSEYYAWFIKKRFNLPLNKPLRGAHISFINDDINKMMQIGKLNANEAEAKWIAIKKIWDGKLIEIDFNPSPRTNGEHWWLKPYPDCCETLDNIRDELFLGKPYFNYHLSLGYANEKFIDHSNYIHSLIKQGLIS